MCSKMENESSARMHMIDEGRGWVRFKFESAFMPMDVAFKWGEQYETSLPMPGGAVETFK